MCECGCIGIDYQGKIIDKNGDAWLLGVYPSCENCSAPVGIQIWKVVKGSFHQWEVDRIPEIELWDDGSAFIEILDSREVRKQMEKAILDYEPSSGKIDKYDAEVLADEAFGDMRDVVFSTRDRVRKDEIKRMKHKTKTERIPVL